jgi:hypothetical protein
MKCPHCGKDIAAKKLDRARAGYEGWFSPFLPRLIEWNASVKNSKELVDELLLIPEVIDRYKDRSYGTRDVLSCTVWQVSRRIGITLIPFFAKDKVTERHRKILALRRKGKTFSEIGRLLNVSTGRPQVLFKAAERREGLEKLCGS